VHRDTNYIEKFVRQSLINCAIHDSLAAAMFLQIAGARPRIPPQMQYVELRVVKVGIIVSQSIDHHNQQTTEAYRHFARERRCSFSPCGDRKGEVVLEETQRSQRVRESYEDVLGGEPPHLAGMEAKIRSI